MRRDGPRHHFRLPLFAALCALAAGCGSGGGDDSSQGMGGGGNGGGGGGSMLVATFESIQQNVFSAQCEVCHTGANAPHGLRLDPASSYGLLVGVPSDQQPSLQRVEPGNPDDSYLIRKLEGTAAVGARMPLSLPALPQSDIDVIRQWITDGALQTPEEPPTEPIRVSSMSPLPDASESTLPMNVRAMFDRELDATSVDATTFTLVRSGGDGTFGDGNDVTVTPDSVMVPQANPQTAVMDLSSVASVNDTYRVTLAGSGAAVIQDLDANALDGEFAGTFPSGDGTAGGDFTAEFEVAGVEPNLTSIQDNVFTPICSACHTDSGAGLPGSMNLTDADASFANLVGVASEQSPGQQRVEAGNADASYLIDKLDGTASTRMPPPPMNALEPATIDAIRQWIDAGAAMP